MAPGSASRERQVLAVLVDRRVVRHHAVDHAFCEAARERVAIALAPSGGSSRQCESK